MLINQIIQFVRFIRKDLLHSFLNIIGLAIGMASCVVIFLYAQNELTYDRFHENYKSIYRYGVEMTIGGPPTTQSTENAAMGIILKEEYPEIKNVARFSRVGRVLVKFMDKEFYESNLLWADSSTFDVFTYKFLLGDPKTSLAGTDNVVLTRKLADKYFGKANPIGEILDIRGIGLMQVAGVIENLPSNSLNQFDGLLSFSTLYKDSNYEKQRNPSQLCSNMNTHIFFQVHKNFSELQFYEKFNNIHQKYLSQLPFGYKPIIEPISDTYLNSSIWPTFSAANRVFLYGFSAVGILILVLASINFVNLSTSRATLRAKEIGVKKVIGAKWIQLIRQFLFESLMLSILSMILATSIVELLLNNTSFKELIGINLRMNLFGNPTILLGMICMVLFTGIISGLYPAFYLSGIKPVSSLSKDKAMGRGIFSLRKLLVAMQFVISLLVVSTMLLMRDQIEFAKTKDLGFNFNNLMVIESNSQETSQKLNAFKEEIKSIPSVSNATITNFVPGLGTYGMAFKWENEEGEMEVHAFQMIMVDKDFVSTLGLQLVEGTDYTTQTTQDESLQFLVNESLVKEMGWSKAVGKRNERGSVVGVVKDFNSNSIRVPIGPMFIVQSNRQQRVINIKLTDRGVDTTIGLISEKWASVVPDTPFEYSFLEQRLRENYRTEITQSKILTIFSFICIAISCLGLLSLTSFTTQRRTKEIGIRKVFGAQSSSIISLILKEIGVLHTISMLLALPLSIYIYNMWLNNFAYKTDTNYYVFIITYVGAAIIVFAVSSYHIIRAAQRNLVDSLRHE
jgi:putative ABC transport system permease protein